MNFEFPLVIFTVLTQFAVGLALFAVFKHAGCCTSSARACQEDTVAKSTTWKYVFLLSCAGLVASFFHLGQPLRAIEALGAFAASWLSREVLFLAIFTLLALVNIFRQNCCLVVLTAVCGVAGLVAQGMTYAPISMPAVANGVPMLIFLLSALALGAAAGQVKQSRDLGTAFRMACAALVAVLLIAPCIWTSGGGSVMRDSAMLWMHSWMFWLGLGLIVAALVASLRSGVAAAAPTLGLVLCGVVLTRIVFFSGTVHTAVNLGMPY